MAGDTHSAEETKIAHDPQDGGQQAQEEVQVKGVDLRAAIKERDSRIAELEAQVVEAAKNAETAEQLRGEIAELKARGEGQRVEFELRLAGVRNVKAAKAILSDYGGDVTALREAEPWLFAETPEMQSSGRTGLPNAGTSSDDGKTMGRWRRLAGLDDDN